MITIYGKKNCPQCDMAKRLCEVKGVKFKYLLIGIDYEKEDLEDLMKTTVRSVPQIFIDGKHVGGYKELNELLQG